MVWGTVVGFHHLVQVFGRGVCRKRDGVAWASVQENKGQSWERESDGWRAPVGASHLERWSHVELLRKSSLFDRCRKVSSLSWRLGVGDNGTGASGA